MAGLFVSFSVDVSDFASLGSDEALETAFSQGGPHALRLAYDRYGSLVFSFCRRTLSAEAAEDAAQETYVAAWRSHERYDPDRGSLGGWLIGIARYKVIEQLRRNARSPEPTAESAVVAGLGNRHLDVEGIADRMLLTDALDQLSPRARTMVELAFYEDLTHAEIAERCGVALGTVKSDLRRGMDRLRRHLINRSEVHHG